MLDSPPIAIVMGSQSDWPTMRHTAERLDELGVCYTAQIVSAHRTPDRLVAFAKGARQAGYKVESAASVRKALGLLKKLVPDVIVAEFNYQSDFRDRTSSLESLLAVVQRTPQTKVIVFYEKDHAHQLTRLTNQYPVHAALAYPIDPQLLVASLR